jgi:hypothetical protein
MGKMSHELYYKTSGNCPGLLLPSQNDYDVDMAMENEDLSNKIKMIHQLSNETYSTFR